VGVRARGSQLRRAAHDPTLCRRMVLYATGVVAYVAVSSNGERGSAIRVRTLYWRTGQVSETGSWHLVSPPEPRQPTKEDPIHDSTAARSQRYIRVKPPRRCTKGYEAYRTAVGR